MRAADAASALAACSRPPAVLMLQVEYSAVGHKQYMKCYRALVWDTYGAAREPSAASSPCRSLAPSSSTSDAGVSSSEGTYSVYSISCKQNGAPQTALSRLHQ